MEIPDQLIIEQSFYASDGGSIALSLREPAGARHSLTLWQHMFTESYDPDRLPGRLYFDQRLVAVRGAAEGALLACLRRAPREVAEALRGAVPERSGPGMIVGQDLRDFHAKVKEGPAAAQAHLVDQLIDYVESEAYVELARSLGV